MRSWLKKRRKQSATDGLHGRVTAYPERGSGISQFHWKEREHMEFAQELGLTLRARLLYPILIPCADPTF